jgi:hypothetical protein
MQWEALPSVDLIGYLKGKLNKPKVRPGSVIENFAGPFREFGRF